MQDLIPAQRAAGLEAFALVHGIPGVKEIPPDDPSWLRRIPVLRELAFVPIAPTARRELARAIADFKPDYLHVHLPNVTPLLIFTLPEARRLPLVIHWHSDVVASDHSRVLRWFYPFYQPYERLLLEHADLVIATSEAYLRSSLALDAVREKCVVVPLGIPITKPRDALHQQSRAQEAPDWLSGKLRLLCLGRLTYYKGHDSLIRAMSYCPEAQLLIVGDGEQAFALQRLIDELGLGGRVKLLGYVDDRRKQELLASADIFCLPSRERTEAFGLALLEAMQHSLPLIVSLIPGSGVGWVARHQHNALAVPIDDPMAWRDAILTLGQHPELRRKLGQAGRQRLERLFDIVQSNDAYSMSFSHAGSRCQLTRGTRETAFRDSGAR
jgi:Glycosyltransferase